MLNKLGDNKPERETVILSTTLQRINRLGITQDRILLLTDKAMYDISPEDVSKCNRRAEFTKLVFITQSAIENLFVIHIREEREHIFQCENYEGIIIMIQKLYQHCTGKEIEINNPYQ